MNINDFDYDQIEEDFLKGPLLKRRNHPASLETFDDDWRPAAQAFGFRDAAFVLITYVEQSPGRIGHTLLHPILYTLRHSIELRLKVLIERYDGRWPTHHKIAPLWDDVKKLAVQRGIEADMSTLNRIMKELHDVDPIGDTFRYSRGKDGESTPLPSTEIDITHLHLQMRAIDIALDGLATMLDEAATHEMQAG